MLGHASHVEGGKADFLVFAGALGTEEVLTAVWPAQWVLFSVVSRKREFVVAWNTEIIIVIVGMVMGIELWNG